jgi:hypothetical protein
MPRVKQDILPHMIAHGTPTLRGPHITLFLERWLETKRNQCSVFSVQSSAKSTEN